MKKKILHTFDWLILLGSTLMVCIFLGIILWDIFSKGLPVISWNFIHQYPTSGMTKGGILPAIVGTVLLTFITTFFAVPFGLACAVYLNEYAHPKMRRTVKPVLEILAAIPTVVYGFFALTVVTPYLQTIIPGLAGFNALSPGIVMGIMIIPLISSLSEDALYACLLYTSDAADE